MKACPVKLPEVSYNLREKIEDRNKITILPFLFNKGNACSIQLISPSYRLAGSSNNANATYQQFLSRDSYTTLLCNNLQQPSYFPSTSLKSMPC